MFKYIAVFGDSLQIAEIILARSEGIIGEMATLIKEAVIFAIMCDKEQIVEGVIK